MIKYIIKTFIISGFIFAVSIMIFDFLREKEFDILKVVLNFLIFGFFMSLGAWYRKKRKK